VQAADLGNDFVFEDVDDDEPVWDQEARIAAQPVESMYLLPSLSTLAGRSNNNQLQKLM
jgi:hypothetical protein